jgi:hypothetical protein
MNAAMRKFVILILIGMFVQLGVMCYVVYSSYEGRKTLVTSQRAGCERGKKDRRSANVLGSSTLLALQDTDSRNPDPLTDDRVKAETDIIDELFGLQIRANIDCSEVYPKASLFP